jgi:hypothetical protein
MQLTALDEKENGPWMSSSSNTDADLFKRQHQRLRVERDPLFAKLRETIGHP